MMNLDVSVRLIDQLSRPARGVADSLERLNRAATRLTGAGGAGAARNIRGLSRAFAALDAAAPSAGATTRIERFTSAINGLAADHQNIRATASALNSLGGAVSRLSQRASEMQAAARGMTAMRRAMAGGPAGGSSFLAAQNAQLTSMLAMQRQAIANMTRLGNAGGGGRGGLGQRGAKTPGVMSFAAGYVGSAVASRAAHDLFTAGVSREQAQVMLKLRGMAEADQKKLLDAAEAVTNADPSRTLADNLNIANTVLTGVGGDVAKAVVNLKAMAAAATELQYTGQSADDVKEQIYDLSRVGELQGIIGDPVAMQKLINSVVSASISTAGHVNVSDWHQNVKKAQGANLGWDQDFVENAFPFMMQELKGGSGGGPTGTALQQFFRAIPMAVQKKGNDELWDSIGMLDRSKVDADGKMKAGAVKNSDLAVSNPAEFVFAMKQAMEERGIKDLSKQVQLASQLFGTTTSRGLVNNLLASKERFEGFKRSNALILDSNKALGLINNTAGQSVLKLGKSAEDLAATLFERVNPLFRTLADDVGGATRLFNGRASGGDAVGAAGVGMLGAGGVIAAAGSIAATVAGLGALASTLPAAAIAATAGAAVLGGKYVWDRFHPADAGQPSIAGKRAAGGPVSGGKTYLVGENGPELFTLGGDGGITPNGGMRGYASLGGGANYGSQLVSLAREQLIVLLDMDNMLSGKGSGGGGIVRASWGGGDGGAGISGAMRGIGGGAVRSALVDSAQRLVGQGAVSGDKRARAMRAMARLIGHGWTEEAAATAVGQAMQESGVKSDGPLGDTRRYGFGDNAAHGMFQWRAERFRALKAFADKRGKPWKDFDTQVDFFDAESKSHGQKSWRGVHDLVTGNRYGKSFEGYGDNSFATRLGNARSALQSWRNGGKVAVPGADQPAAQVPEALRAHEQQNRDCGTYSASNGAGGHTTHIGSIAINVQSQPHHDENKIAESVHRKFNAAIASQLNDGFMA